MVITIDINNNAKGKLKYLQRIPGFFADFTAGRGGSSGFVCDAGFFGLNICRKTNPAPNMKIKVITRITNKIIIVTIIIQSDSGCQLLNGIINNQESIVNTSTNVEYLWEIEEYFYYRKIFIDFVKY